MPGRVRGEGSRAPVAIIEQDNYEVAWKLAREKLAALDPAAQARRCGVELVGGVFRITYLGREYEVTRPAGEMKGVAPSVEAPPLWEQILILHYLSSTDPVPATREAVAFAEIPSGAFYDPAFQKRARAPLLKTFGEKPELLGRAGDALGARREEQGDASVTVTAFPNVPVTIVLWRGDDEFPAEASILFRGDISGYLSTEDVAVLAGIVASRLIKIARSMG